MSSLEQYKAKRDFGKTPEPEAVKSKRRKKPVFVIQQHGASRLHYDFRLEIGGTLASWAVPKGPSTDPSEKRLAMRTEDHPLEYAGFEGVIPKGQYGAGAVIIWDKGTYRNLTRAEEEGRAGMGRSLKEGRIEIWLNGKKIKGGYYLIRTGNPKDRRWLLIKADDGEADARRNPVSTQSRSVKSQKTLEEIKREHEQNA